MPEPARRNTTIRNRFREQARRRGDSCHICGQTIDYTIKSPAPMSFEADHIQALKPKDGSTPGQDIPSNLAASHRGCNSKKRARAYAPIVRRSASLN